MKTTTLDAAASEFSLARQHRPKTAESYLSAVRRFQRITGVHLITQITTESLVDFRDNYEGSAATKRSTFRSLRALLREAKRRKLIRIVPDFPVVRGSKNLPVVMTIDELDRIISQVEQATWPKLIGVNPSDWWKCWLATAYITGLRFSDLMLLKMPEDRFEHRASKTGKVHQIPCPQWLRELYETIRARPGDVLFPVDSSQHQTFRRHFAGFVGAAGVRSELGPQCIRRMAVTEWSAVSSDAGRIIHGTALGILDYYLDPFRHLSDALPRLRIPSQLVSDDEAERLRLEELRLVTLYRGSNPESRATLMSVADKIL